MGLDAWVEKVPKKYVVNDFRFRSTELLEADTEFYYWRKDWGIQDWFQALYIKKGGQNHYFNGDYIRFTLSDLDKLEYYLVNISQPSYRDDGLKKNLEFIKKARNTLKKEKNIALYYCSSW